MYTLPLLYIITRTHNLPLYLLLWLLLFSIDPTPASPGSAILHTWHDTEIHGNRNKHQAR